MATTAASAVSSFSIGDMLYHTVHGLCRVSEVIKEPGAKKGNVSYALLPNRSNRMKLRYVVSAASLTDSGFHSLISLEDANSILTYLKRGFIEAKYESLLPQKMDDGSISEGSTTWALAQCLLKSAQDDAYAAEQRKRQTLGRAARGLVLELSIVLKLSPKDTAERIQSCLQKSGKLNPLILTALENAVEEPME